MDKTKYIDPIIGSVGDNKAEGSHGGGKTHPGACTPGGMVQLSPDTVTGADEGSGYNYTHNTIEGFSFNHVSGMGCYGDLGNLQIMPVVGDPDLRSGSNAEVPFDFGKDGWKSTFSHEKEYAKAGYYSVELDTYGILAEATVTPRCGLLRFTYPENSDAKVIFNFSRRIAGHADFEYVNIVNKKLIEGCIVCTGKGGGFGRGKFNITYNLFFVLELSEPMKSFRFFENEKFLDENLVTCGSDDVGLLASFDTEKSNTVTLRCGISYTSLEGARENLDLECPHFDFDKVRKNADKLWENAFDSVSVSGSDERDLTVFYSCLYHTLLDPRILADNDGNFRTPDGELHKVSHTQRTIFSGWDVYRSEFPLLSIIAPEIVNDEASSLLKMADYTNSAFPRYDMMGTDARGCMLGDAGLLVVADAFLKGIKCFDYEKAYEIALLSSKALTERNGKPFEPVRIGEESYIKDAFVSYAPVNEWSDNHSLSKTLEYLLSDYVMYRFASALGKTQDAQYFINRVKRYGENYNKNTGFMGPRDKDGKFVPVSLNPYGATTDAEGKPLDDRYCETGCIESNIYQQSFFVPYDIPGLSEIFGKERFIELLEELFEKADLSAMWNINYNHSNEPCHNLTHYFNALGLPHRTQYWTRRVQKEAYRTGAFGFCGNEDVGQLSAWFVLSALGFAQVCIGNENYFVNTPLFKDITIKLSKKYHSCKVADTLVIECDNDPLEYPYISKMFLNGKELRRSYLTYAEITAGGKLTYILSKEPDLTFGKELPGSFLE